MTYIKGQMVIIKDATSGSNNLVKLDGWVSAYMPCLNGRVAHNRVKHVEMMPRFKWKKRKKTRSKWTSLSSDLSKKIRNKALRCMKCPKHLWTGIEFHKQKTISVHPGQAHAHYPLKGQSGLTWPITITKSMNTHIILKNHAPTSQAKHTWLSVSHR